jgi:myo-inositol-1(or 4)-monophosphatase
MSGLQPSVVERLKPVLAEADHVRQFGANALEMCYLARGFLDAYVDLRGKVRPTDVASACLIAKEAGCNLRSDNGSELDSDLDVKTRLSYVAAANSRVLNQLARHLF